MCEKRGCISHAGGSQEVSVHIKKDQNKSKPSAVSAMW